MNILYRSLLVVLVLLVSSQTFAAEYYVLVAGQQQGPVSVEQLIQMKDGGTITRDTLIWKDGMAEWESVGTQNDLQSLFTSLAPPQPPQTTGATPPPVPAVTSLASNGIISQTDINEQNSMSDPKLLLTASDSMDDWFDSVLQTFGMDNFGENNGKFIFASSHPVMLKPIDPQYGDAVTNAFDKAMMTLQKKYLMARFGKTTTEKIKSLYSDRSTNANEIELPPVNNPGGLDKLVAVFKKGLDVAEKKLDQELIELGVDSEELARLTPKKKKDVFRDKFLKNTIRKASGSIAGLFPIQTNIITDSTGLTVIGIVAIASPKTEQIAKDISLQRDSIIRGKGKDMKELLPAAEEDYLGTLGVRLLYDIDGRPAIISYGMSSYRPDTGDDYINDALKSEAKADAVSNADAQIAEIINGRLNVKEERSRGEEVRKSVEREMKLNSDTIEKTINNIIKITKNHSKSSASAKLQGISTVKNWRYTDKNGHKFVGAVRVWTYSTLQAVNSLNSKKNKKGSVIKKKQSFNTFQKSSKPVNSIEDF